MRLSLHSRTAFTLIELAIVLVIIGLLVGGVLAGQSLIRAAELRSIGTDYRSYQTALGAFRDKYLALPGDMRNAVRYWGAAAGGTADGVDATCAALTTPSTTPATCNGDGDGYTSSYTWETTRAWQHLANAGLAEGSYSGIFNNVTSKPDVGTAIPRTKADGRAGWQWWGVGTIASGGGAVLPSGVYKGASLLLSIPADSNVDAVPFLSAEEAYNVDAKIDDGKPSTGVVRSFTNANGADCADATDTNYQVQNTNEGCVLMFITGY